MNPPDRTLEFWFEFGSNYSYLSVMRIEAAAAEHGVTVLWKPFLLGPIFKALGWREAPFVQQRVKGEYVWRDMERQCRKYGLPWTRPTTFPRVWVLPARVALLRAGEPWIGDFCRRVMLLNFAEDRDINSEQAIGDVLTALELPAAEVMREAQSEPNKARLRKQTDTAQARGVFGAPTFFVGEEMFWGNDRLDDALALAAR
jgi:2-hydroxychromene-2-carboxylate isomerase